MALLFCDNFENWSTTSAAYPGPWSVAKGTWGSGVSTSSVNQYTPNRFQTGGMSQASSLVIGLPETQIVICNIKGSFFEEPIGGDSGATLWGLDGGTVQFGIRLQPDGHFAVYRGIDTAKLAQSINAYSLDINTDLDIELKISIHNTTGTVELRVNGITEINLTNQNTRVSANNFIDEIRIGKGAISQVARAYFKHFIIMDTTGAEMNDLIGPVDVTSLRPNADGNYTAWTALAGNRWDAVNDAVTDADATYVHAATLADKVSFGLTDLPAGVTNVFGIMPQAQVKREQGTTRITKFLMRSGGTDQLGTRELAIGPTYAFRQEPISLSPFTAAAWTPAEINALELGMEITT